MTPKYLAIIFLGLFLISFASAELLTLDNKVEYTDESLLKVDIVNTFGLGETLGTIELKSHKSVDEVRKIYGTGYQVAMYYDLYGWELYENGLGNVYFTDQRTGKDTDKQYYFAKWTEKEEITYTIINNKTGETEENKRIYYEWEKYNSRDIPNTKTEKIRIALIVYVEEGDYTDAIWTIAGKRIKEHASWVLADAVNVGNITKTSNWIGMSWSNDGTRLFSFNGVDAVLSAFNCSSAWDVTSCTTNGETKDISALTTGRGMFFGDSGNKLYIVYAGGNDDIAEYSCATAWNVASCSGTKTNNTQDSNSEGIGWSTDGLNFYEYGRALAYHSTCTTAWDLWSCTNSGGTMAMPGGETIEDGSWKQDDGTKVYFVGLGSDKVYQYGCTTGWDLSSCSSDSVDVQVYGPTPLSLFFAPDGNNFYVGEASNLVSQFQMLGGPTDDPPSVVINSPANYDNLSTSTETFQAVVTDDLKVQNVSLMQNGTIIETNTSQHNGTYTFTKSDTAGFYNWSIIAYDNASQKNESTERFYTITIVAPNITLYTPEDNLISSSFTHLVSGQSWDDFGLANVSLYVNSVRVDTDTGISNPYNYTQIRSFGQGVNTWYLEAYDNDSNPTTSATRTLTIDTIAPGINIDYPANGTIYNSNYTSTNSTTIWLNWTASDPNIDDCLYDFGNGTKIAITCNASTSLDVTFKKYSLRFWANDSVNNTASDLRTPDYQYVYYENAHTYNPTSTETFDETFTLNLTLGTGVTLNQAFFNYGGVVYNPSITTNGQQKILSKTITIPDITATENKTFFWTLNSNQVNYNTTEINQTISPLVIDDCTTNKIYILNYTIYDEGTRLILPAIQNTSAEISIRLGGDVNGNEYKEYNLTSTANHIPICVNASLGSQNYRLDTEIQYNADDYVTEYHYLNNHTLNSSVNPINISLYLLKTTDSQEFLINYEDKNLVPQEGVYIEIWRQYLGIGKFLQVEVAKTDNDGRTIGHFVLNDELYNLYGYEEDTKELKFFYENVRAFCVDVTTGDCQINIQEQINYENPSDLNDYLGVIGSESYNDETKLYSFSFTTKDSTAKKVNLTIYKYDVYLSNVVCSSEDTATSGTFTCTIPAEYYNGSVLAEIYVEDELYSSNVFYVSSFGDQGLNAGGFILAFLLIVTLPLLALGSGPMTLVLFIIGLFMAGGLFLVNMGGFIGGFSAFLWFVIAGVILLIKSSKRREQ